MSAPVDGPKLADAPPALFSREIDDGAMFAGIAAVVVVVGVLICSFAHKGEVQLVTKNPLPATVGQNIAAATR